MEGIEELHLRALAGLERLPIEHGASEERRPNTSTTGSILQIQTLKNVRFKHLVFCHLNCEGNVGES